MITRLCRAAAWFHDPPCWCSGWPHQYSCPRSRYYKTKAVPLGPDPEPAGTAAGCGPPPASS